MSAACCCCGLPAARLRRGDCRRTIMGNSYARPRTAAWRWFVRRNSGRSASRPIRATANTSVVSICYFIDVLSKWKEIFVAGAHQPVMGVSEEELRSIKAPTIVIPGNDKVHSSASGLAAHRLIAGSRLHRLPIVDQDIPLIPFADWANEPGRRSPTFGRTSSPASPPAGKAPSRKVTRNTARRWPSASSR